MHLGSITQLYGTGGISTPPPEPPSGSPDPGGFAEVGAGVRGFEVDVGASVTVGVILSVTVGVELGGLVG